MKILSKLKHLIIGLGIGITTFTNKVFAFSPNELNIIDPGKTVALYGIPSPQPVKPILKLFKTFIIPISVVVGLLVYFKKSKSNKKKKIIVTIITLIIVALAYFLLNSIF